MKHLSRHKQSYQYIDTTPEQEGPPVVLLHGLLGKAMEWSSTIDVLAAHDYRVILPFMPLDNLQASKTNLNGVLDYLRGFMKALRIEHQAVLIGNSLGGQIALLYALHYPEAVIALVLSGSSGISEVGMGTTIFRRKDRDFIRERAARTFFDPAHVTEELVERIHTLVNDRRRALRILKLARSSLNQNLNDRLRHIDLPTQLIWGRNDEITPPEIAIIFKQLLPCAELHFIDQCGHAPMLEHPEIFNALALEFLKKQPSGPA